jgi:hypothetical protein
MIFLTRPFGKSLLKIGYYTEVVRFVFRSKKFNAIEPTEVNLISQPGLHPSPDNSELRPKNRRFETLSLSWSDSKDDKNTPELESEYDKTEI